MLIRPEALKQTGSFDEDYFVFLEETDLCLRLRHKGWKIVIIPEAKVYHLAGGTKKQANILARIEYLKSLYKFFHKHKSPVIYGLIRGLYPLRLFLQLVFTGLGCILTLGFIRKIRKRWFEYFYLFVWHLGGCPASWTLKYRKN
jgi:hypothetical protein